LSDELGMPRDKYRDNFLDLAAIGTVADVMPLIGENRIITHFGLQRLAEGRKVGLRALMREANVVAPLRSSSIGFGLGPRLNAAGRIDDAALSLQLVLCTDEIEATELAQKLEIVNTQRKTEQNRIIDEAADRIRETGADQQNVIVLADPGWHPGIVGIVAGRLVEQFRRPVFVLNVDEKNQTIKGSGRSIPKFHLAEAIKAHPDLFLSGGGHAMAAGCSFEKGKLQEVIDTLHTYGGTMLTPDDFIPVKRIDAELDPTEITKASVMEMSKLEPFGFGNPTPQFVARDLEVLSVLPTKNPIHCRASLRGSGVVAQAMAFNMGERMSSLLVGAKIDALFEAVIDRYNGYETLKWHLRDYVEL
jgi:single-stranded-DNA-specific exonuclease